MQAETLSNRVISYVMLSGARRLLYRVRRLGASVYTKDGVTDGKPYKTCYCKVVRLSSGNVSLDYKSDANRARYSNLISCGSVWSCPICSDLIHRERRNNLMQINLLMEKTHHIVMFTLTLSHKRETPFSASRFALREAYSRLRKPVRWRKFKKQIGYEFDVTAIEVTFGHLNGFHPHFHVLAYLKKSAVELLRTVDDDGETQHGLDALVIILWRYLNTEWINQLKLLGFSASPEYAVRVDASDSYVADYVAKFGRLPRKWTIEDEMTRTSKKAGKLHERFTPHQLLYEYSINSQEWAGRVWLQYAVEMYGKTQLRLSKGFKRYLNENGIHLISDELAAQSEQNDESYHALGSFTSDEWSRLLDAGLRGLLLDYVSAVNGDGNKIRQFLVDAGVFNNQSKLFK